MSKKITIYTADNCPYCTRAKALLQQKGVTFEEIRMSWGDEKAWADAQARSGMKTVPQIFIGEKCVGGYTDLAALEEKGELDALLGR
ncbi:MAG: glutaredoxin 3 [Bdellovibrionales bacterium]|nr:glutaredoxin 3 [Bdellovibrionales bacterium]